MIKYEVKSDVKIRRGVGIKEGVKDGKPYTNQVGLLSAGTQNVEILSTQVLTDNSLWGRFSEPDSSGIAQWICIKNINRTFMLPMADEFQPTDSDSRLARIEMKLDILLSKSR